MSVNFSSNLDADMSVEVFYGDMEISGSLFVKNNLVVKGIIKVGENEECFLVAKKDLEEMSIEELLTHENNSLRELAKLFFEKAKDSPIQSKNTVRSLA